MSKKEQRIQQVFEAHLATAVHGATVESKVAIAYDLLADLGITHDDIVSAMPEFTEAIENHAKPPVFEFPATVLAHWAGGPVACCEHHAKGLQTLGSVMGASVPLTPLTEPSECINCVNEAKSAATA